MAYRIEHGDCRDVMAALAADSIDAIVTDPPYGLSFMGRGWDHGVPGVEFWVEALRVAKPGAHLVAFGGTRTYHRLACAVEDAGWEIRDQIGWVYGTGFPKSLDVSKAIDKDAGVEFEARPASGVGFMGPDGPGGYNVTKNQLSRVGEQTDAARQWAGWGTALKPAWEPIVLARKPLIGTVAANVQAHGTGALNIDGCRIGNGVSRPSSTGGMAGKSAPVFGHFAGPKAEPIETTLGRWPANLVHDGSDEVLERFPAQAGGGTGRPIRRSSSLHDTEAGWGMRHSADAGSTYADSGSAARFFYCAKASRAERDGSKHPTVKPVALMRWLVRLVTPPGGTVLDPFAGSGTTGQAAIEEGCDVVLIEREAEHIVDIWCRMAGVEQ